MWRDDFTPAVSLTQLDTRALDDRGPDANILLSDYRVDLGERLGVDHSRFEMLSVSEQTGNTILTVPAGTVTDFSSERWWMTPVLGRRSRRKWAGAGHDRAYYEGLPRGVADRIWWIMARSGGQRVGRVRAAVGWAGLRLFGWVAYRNHSKRRAVRDAARSA